MQQPTLFPLAPNAYGAAAPIMAAKADPVTSHEAAARVARSGRRQRNRAIALALVRAQPGKTGHELSAQATDAERAELGNFNELYRVLADLKSRGLVKHGDEPRPCTIKGTRMVVWHVA